MEAKKNEPGYELSKEFSTLFHQVKSDLFVQDSKGESEKTKRDALDKVRIIASKNVVDKDYLEDLKQAIQIDAIAGWSLREINHLKPADFANLPNIVRADYIESALHNFESISKGKEILVAAEEIQKVEINI